MHTSPFSPQGPRQELAATLPSNPGKAWGQALAGLFFPIINIGAILLLLHRMSPEEQFIALVGFLLGVFISASGLTVIERHIASDSRKARMWGGAIALGVVFLAVSVPLTRLLCPVFYEGYWLALVQPTLWSMLWPLMHRLFFLSVPPRDQGFTLGIALAAGHAFWAVTVLILVEVYLPASETTPLNRFSVLLYYIRSVFAAGFAYVVWRLFKMLPVLLDRARALRNSRIQDGEDASQPAPSPSKILLWLLIPLSISFFINGFTHFIFLPRLNLREAYPEYTQLVFILLFSGMAFLLHRYGNAMLKFLLMGSIMVCFSVPWLFRPQPVAWLHQAIYVTCIIGYQVQLFIGMLITGNLASRCPRPALATAALLLGMTVSLLAGSLFQRYLQPLLPFSSFAVLTACTLLCLASLPAAYRALRETDKDVMPPLQPALPASSGIAEAVSAFSAHHGLSPREREVLELLVQGHSTGGMADMLGLKENSVRFYIRTLLKKTRTNSRVELISAFVNRDRE